MVLLLFFIGSFELVQTQPEPEKQMNRNFETLKTLRDANGNDKKKHWKKVTGNKTEIDWIKRELELEGMRFY